MTSLSSNIQRLRHHSTNPLAHRIPDDGKHRNNCMPLYIHFHYMFAGQCRPWYIQKDPTDEILKNTIGKIYLIAEDL